MTDLSANIVANGSAAASMNFTASPFALRRSMSSPGRTHALGAALSADTIALNIIRKCGAAVVTAIASMADVTPIADELTVDGLVLRYRTHETDDGPCQRADVTPPRSCPAEAEREKAAQGSQPAPPLLRQSPELPVRRGALGGSMSEPPRA